MPKHAYKYLIIWGLLVSCASDGFNMALNEDTLEPWTETVVKDIPGKRYGVRWLANDDSDLGERCFDAIGLRARFGVGNTYGASDFDHVYPWNQIRRCNIRCEAGVTIITYDDDPAFKLDGSNGDVFVRIPKCYVEKYREGDYEYRVVSAIGRKPHPAFIENGLELDAIYVSAFEGWMSSDSLLHSVADVIPTSNITAQQFLDAAQRRGPQYSLYDMRTIDLLYTLIAVEFGCRNTGIIFGHGIADYCQPQEKQLNTERNYYSLKMQQQTNSITCQRQWKNLITVGSAVCICQGNQNDILTFARVTNISTYKGLTTYTFDGPPIDITPYCFIGNCGQVTNWTETCSAPHSSYMGRANIMENGFLPRERNPMRYRWMENLVGNLWHFIPDVTLFNQQLYVCDNMAHYQFGCFDGAYTPFGPSLPLNTDNSSLIDKRGINYWISALVDDSEGKGISMGVDYNRTMLSTEGFGAYYYVGTGLCILVNGGGFDHRFRCNMLTTRAWDSPNRRWHLYGARLIFKEI